METFESFHGIKLLSGQNSHPGSGPAQDHELEWDRFSWALDNLDATKDQSYMLELGSFWGLWSLAFRKRFPNGHNVLVEYGSHQLSVGRKNFEANDLDAKFIHAGVFINKSGTARRVKSDVQFNMNGILGAPGGELELHSFFLENSRFDLIHADIQGSEWELIRFLCENRYLELLNNQVIVICSHSARNHFKIKKQLLTNGYLIVQEDQTFGYFGHLVFRGLRLVGKPMRERVFHSKTLVSLIASIERILSIGGQTSGIGQDGWLVFSKRR
jgi:hypothetical protein